jgi:hypothetical protein
MNVGELVTGTTTDGAPVIGYVTRLHTYPSIRVCIAPGHYVDVDLATAVIL